MHKYDTYQTNDKKNLNWIKLIAKRKKKKFKNLENYKLIKERKEKNLLKKEIHKN